MCSDSCPLHLSGSYPLVTCKNCENGTNTSECLVNSPFGRVSVRRGSQLVPLLAASSGQHLARRQPWKGLVIEQHEVRRGEIPEHQHPTLCLHLQIAGDEDFEWWQGGKNSVEHSRAGSLIILPSGTQDRVRRKGTSKRLILSIETESLIQCADQQGAQTSPEIKLSWSMQDSTLRHLLTEMGREASEGWPLGALYADLLALSLQSNLLRNHSTQRKTLPSYRGRLGLPKLRRALDFMSANLAHDIGLDEIARAMGMSASHFAHEFRRSTRTTPYQYMLEQRLRRARHLLTGTNLPILDIAQLTGFHYPANFVRTFRQRVGIPPERWRKEQGLQRMSAP